MVDYVSAAPFAHSLGAGRHRNHQSEVLTSCWKEAWLVAPSRTVPTPHDSWVLGGQVVVATQLGHEAHCVSCPPSTHSHSASQAVFYLQTTPLKPLALHVPFHSGVAI